MERKTYLASLLLALLKAAGVKASEEADDVVMTLALDAPRLLDADDEVVDEEFVRHVRGASSNGGGGVEQQDSGTVAKND